MEGLFKILLLVHVLAGSIGLLTGTYILLRPKGDKLHQLIGKFFAYGMLLSALVSLIMSSMHHNLFLFIVGVFTIYMVGTGLRYLKLKNLQKGQKPKLIDWLLFGLMLLFSVLFLVYGSYFIVKANNFGWVLISFGAISGLMLQSDWQTFKGIKIKYQNYWLLLHLQRMTGAYIASLTAFIVVNNHYLPNVLAWLLPTIIVTPLIVKWSRKFSR